MKYPTVYLRVKNKSIEKVEAAVKDVKLHRYPLNNFHSPVFHIRSRYASTSINPALNRELILNNDKKITDFEPETLQVIDNLHV